MTDRTRPPFHHRLALYAGVVALIILAWLQSWRQDDDE